MEGVIMTGLRLHIGTLAQHRGGMGGRPDWSKKERNKVRSKKARKKVKFFFAHKQLFETLLGNTCVFSRHVC